MTKIFTTITLSFFLMFSLLFFGSTESFALREILRSPEEMAKSSEDIVVANCVKSEVKKDENTGFIFTYTTFKVNESLKGEYGDEIVLRTIGGTVGDMTVSSPDSPTFQPNEEVVLFLGPKNTKGYPVLKSINNGIYRISTDEVGAKVVMTPVGDMQIINSKTNSKDENSSKVYLDDFIHTITQSM